MIGNILTAIAIAILTIAICIQVARTNGAEKDIDLLGEVVSKKASEIDVEVIKTRLTQEIVDVSNAERQIKEIFEQLDKITKDIARLDGEVGIIKHDEKEIRSYYVNFREPKHSNSGVEWASEVRCADDTEL